MTAEYATLNRSEAVVTCAHILRQNRFIVALTTVPVDDHASIAAEVILAIGDTDAVVDGAALRSHDEADAAVRMVRSAALAGRLAVVLNANRAAPGHLWSLACAAQMNDGRLLTIGDGLMYRLSPDDAVFRIVHHGGPLFDAALAKTNKP